MRWIVRNRHPALCGLTKVYMWQLMTSEVWKCPPEREVPCWQEIHISCSMQCLTTMNLTHSWRVEKDDYSIILHRVLWTFLCITWHGFFFRQLIRGANEFLHYHLTRGGSRIHRRNVRVPWQKCISVSEKSSSSIFRVAAQQLAFLYL